MDECFVTGTRNSKSLNSSGLPYWNLISSCKHKIANCRLWLLRNSSSKFKVTYSDYCTVCLVISRKAYKPKKTRAFKLTTPNVLWSNSKQKDIWLYFIGFTSAVMWYTNPPHCMYRRICLSVSTNFLCCQFPYFLRLHARVCIVV